jgi:hypothetical protein
MQLFGGKILIIFSEERGEKSIRPLFPVEKNDYNCPRW